jgi:hypothetical protein
MRSRKWMNDTAPNARHSMDQESLGWGSRARRGLDSKQELLAVGADIPVGRVVPIRNLGLVDSLRTSNYADENWGCLRTLRNTSSRRWIQPMRVLHDRIWSAAQSAAGL